MDTLILQMDNVREYAEGYPVELIRDGETNRICVRAINEGGHNVTNVDLLDLIAWIDANPELIKKLRRE